MEKDCFVYIHMSEGNRDRISTRSHWTASPYGCHWFKVNPFSGGGSTTTTTMPTIDSYPSLKPWLQDYNTMELSEKSMVELSRKSYLDLIRSSMIIDASAISSEQESKTDWPEMADALPDLYYPMKCGSAICGSYLYFFGGYRVVLRHGKKDDDDVDLKKYDDVDLDQVLKLELSTMSMTRHDQKMTRPRRFPRALTIGKEIYIFGADRGYYVHAPSVSPFAEVFDTVTGKFTPLVDPPSELMNLHDDISTAVVVKGGQKILILMKRTKAVFFYDRMGQSWESAQSQECSPLFSRGLHMFNNNKTMVAIDDILYCYNCLDSAVHAYDLRNNQWFEGLVMSFPKRDEVIDYGHIQQLQEGFLTVVLYIHNRYLKDVGYLHTISFRPTVNWEAYSIHVHKFEHHSRYYCGLEDFVDSVALDVYGASNTRTQSLSDSNHSKASSIEGSGGRNAGEPAGSRRKKKNRPFRLHKLFKLWFLRGLAALCNRKQVKS